MPPPRPLRLAPEWDDRFGWMLGVSALGHALVVTALVILAGRAGSRPLPLVAYTVELTDPAALGGRVPSGAPAPELSGGPARPPAPEPKGETVEATAKPPEPKPEAKPEPPTPPPPAPEESKPTPPAAEEQTVRLPDVAKPPEPPKPEPKPETKPPEPPKPEPRAQPKPPPKPEPPKPEPKKVEPPKPAAAKPPEAKPVLPKPAPAAQAKAGTPSGQENAPPHDAYGAAAERWRARGSGLAGADAGSGPIGSGGEGPGGGGQLVGLEFMAYRQQVINTVKAQWANVVARPGLVAAVRFEIASDGQVSNVRLAQSSGNAAYDASAMRAVQHVNQLPPPPARYANEFREFMIEFHSEETGGQGTG